MIEKELIDKLTKYFNANDLATDYEVWYDINSFSGFTSQFGEVEVIDSKCYCSDGGKCKFLTVLKFPSLMLVVGTFDLDYVSNECGCDCCSAMANDYMQSKREFFTVRVMNKPMWERV